MKKIVGKAARKKLIVSLAVGGSLTVAAGITVPVLVTQLAKKEATPAAPVIEDLSSSVKDNVTAAYGVQPSELVAPALAGYRSPQLDLSLTNYTARSPVGAPGFKAAFVYHPENEELPAKTVIYGISVVKPHDLVEDLTASEALAYKMAYKTSLKEIKAPPLRDGYAAPVIDTSRTTYDPNQYGATATLGFKYFAADPNAADLIVLYAVRLSKQADVVQSGAPVSVTFGTPADRVIKPAAIANYFAPFVYPQKTTYTDQSPVGAQNLTITWLLSPRDSRDANVYVTSAVAVHKPNVTKESASASVAYGTSQTSAGKPARRNGYAEPALQTALTTYSSASIPGTPGLKTVWLLANDDVSGADVEIEVSITVTRPEDVSETSASTVKYGDQPATVGKPAPRSGYAAPTMVAERTTYTASTPPSTASVVVWKLESQTPGAPDVYVTVSVTVTKQDDLNETAAAGVTYGTAPSSVGKPTARVGYKEAVLVIARTTYTTNTSPGTGSTSTDRRRGKPM